MGSLFDRMKESLQAAGQSARKISDVANRKVDLWDARKILEARYEALGKAIAHRLIDRDERTVDRAEDSIATLLDEVRVAREKVEALERSLTGEPEVVTEIAEIEVRTDPPPPPQADPPSTPPSSSSGHPGTLPDSGDFDSGEGGDSGPPEREASDRGGAPE